jgi:hypothetical protein
LGLSETDIHFNALNTKVHPNYSQNISSYFTENQIVHYKDQSVTYEACKPTARATYIRSLMLTTFGSLAFSYCWTLNAQDGPFVIAVARVGMQLKARMGWITGPQESLFRISPLFCGIFTSRSIPLSQTPRPSACQMLRESLHGSLKNVSMALNTCLCGQSIDMKITYSCR